MILYTNYYDKYKKIQKVSQSKRILIGLSGSECFHTIYAQLIENFIDEIRAVVLDTFSQKTRFEQELLTVLCCGRTDTSIYRRRAIVKERMP